MTIDDLKRLTVVPAWSDDPDEPSAGRALGYRSRSATYAAIGRGAIPVLRLSARRIVVPTWRLLELLGAGTNGNGRGANPGREELPTPSDSTLGDSTPRLPLPRSFPHGTRSQKGGPRREPS